MKGRQKIASSEKQASFKCSFIPEREWRQVKERVFTTLSKMGDKGEGEGENYFFLFSGKQGNNAKIWDPRNKMKEDM